jgi:hypothetical protein
MNAIAQTKTVTKRTKTATKQTKKAQARAYVVTYDSFYLVFTALMGSNNRKTGNMIQTYILDKARLTSEPRVFGAKCEACPLVNKCYVSRDKMSVRRALKALLEGKGTGSYQHATLDQVLPHLEGRSIRFGTYGDPSAIPLDDVAKIVSAAKGHTGYTHFWREIDPAYSAYFMASCESLSDENEARLIGYRSFRVLLKEQVEHEVRSASIECLNSSVGLTCEDCGLCSGTEGKGSSSIYIHEH